MSLATHLAARSRGFSTRPSERAQLQANAQSQRSATKVSAHRRRVVTVYRMGTRPTLTAAPIAPHAEIVPCAQTTMTARAVCAMTQSTGRSVQSRLASTAYSTARKDALTGDAPAISIVMTGTRADITTTVPVMCAWEGAARLQRALIEHETGTKPTWIVVVIAPRVASAVAAATARPIVHLARALPDCAQLSLRQPTAAITSKTVKSRMLIAAGLRVLRVIQEASAPSVRIAPARTVRREYAKLRAASTT